MKCSTMPTNLSMMAARAAFIIMAAVTIGVSASASSSYEPTYKFNNNGLSASVIHASSTTAYEQPPYGEGTHYVEPNIITSTDPTSYKDYTYEGMGMRNIFDRREGGGRLRKSMYRCTCSKQITHTSKEKKQSRFLSTMNSLFVMLQRKWRSTHRPLGRCHGHSLLVLLKFGS